MKKEELQGQEPLTSSSAEKGKLVAEKKGNFFALLPILVFLVLFIGMGVWSGSMYTMPAVVGFLIALAVAFFQNRGLSFEEKMKVAAKGVGDDSILTMLLIFLTAGAFSSVVSAAGGVESAVNFGLSIIPTNFMVVGIFLVGCFISVSMGTSVGTVTALTPFAAGIADKTDLPMALCVGAVVCGAMFGDNLSMVSDTTIAAVKTQGCNMKDKFKANFFIVLPAAILTAVLFYIATANIQYTITQDLSYNLWQVLPYLVVLVGALIGFNVFLVLISGILMSAVVGLVMGKFTFLEMFTIMGTGVSGMFEITVISIIVAAIFHLVKAHGGVDAIIRLIRKGVKGPRGAQLGIGMMSLLVDCCTANNTVAIVMSGPIAKEIGEEYQISPKRTASILDIFTSTGQGLIPYGAQLLTAAGLASISPISLLPNLYYPILMGVSAIICILIWPKGWQRKEKKQPVQSDS